MKTLESISWLVASALLFWANLVSAYRYFSGGE